MQALYNSQTGETVFSPDDIAEVPAQTQEQLDQQYKDIVVSLIREKYSEDDEFAILRKNIAAIDVEGFVAYNNFVEDCKTQVKLQLGL